MGSIVGTLLLGIIIAESKAKIVIVFGANTRMTEVATCFVIEKNGIF